MTAIKSSVIAATPTDKVLTQKWGKASIAAGFTALPNVVFRYAKQLGLKNLDVLVILHLASYWWSAEDHPWPSKSKLAAALDVDSKTIQRSVRRMEDMGYVKRIFRKAEAGDNLSNKYNLDGLVAAAQVLAKTEIAERAQRERNQQARQRTPKTLELIMGGKDDE